MKHSDLQKAENATYETLIAGGSSEHKGCIQAKEMGHLMTQAVNTVNVQP